MYLDIYSNHESFEGYIHDNYSEGVSFDLAHNKLNSIQQYNTSWSQSPRSQKCYKTRITLRWGKRS